MGDDRAGISPILKQGDLFIALQIQPRDRDIFKLGYDLTCYKLTRKRMD
jgi:hypothetical protein